MSVKYIDTNGVRGCR